MTKVRSRRVPVVAARSGEGPLTEPTAAARPWQREPLTFASPTSQPVFVVFTTYALASRLRASWMEARVTKVAPSTSQFAITVSPVTVNT
jgi:hypothetical protein